MTRVQVPRTLFINWTSYNLAPIPMYGTLHVHTHSHWSNWGNNSNTKRWLSTYRKHNKLWIFFELKVIREINKKFLIYEFLLVFEIIDCPYTIINLENNKSVASLIFTPGTPVQVSRSLITNLSAIIWPLRLLSTIYVHKHRQKTTLALVKI